MNTEDEDRHRLPDKFRRGLDPAVIKQIEVRARFASQMMEQLEGWSWASGGPPDKTPP